MFFLWMKIKRILWPFTDYFNNWSFHSFNCSYAFNQQWNSIAIVEIKQLYVTNKTYIIGKIALILESQNNWVTFYHQYLHSRDSILTINNKIYLIRMVSVLYDGKMVQDPYSVVDQILVCRCRCVSRRRRRRVKIVYIMQ